MNYKNEDVLILSAIDPTHAYSCIKYLYRFLSKQGISIECWARVPQKSCALYYMWGKGTHSFCESPFMNIPKVRTYYMRLKGLSECFKYRNKTIICHDLFHYHSARIVKKLFKNTKLIIYFTEIYNNKHSELLQKLQKDFVNHPNLADLMIECDYQREKWRITNNRIKIDSCTILNTISYEEVKKFLNKQKTKNSVPKIAYAGGVHEKGEFSIIIDALSEIDRKFEMDFYCFGSDANLNELETECKQKIPGKYKLIRNLPREDVFDHIYNADAGITYYDPDYSVNTLYAAPTKFFEYIGLAIPVICSGNPSLDSLIDEYGLGVYMKENNSEGMKQCIEYIIDHNDKRIEFSNNEKKAFKDHLCYEKQCKAATSKILNLIKNNCS